MKLDPSSSVNSFGLSPNEIIYRSAKEKNEAILNYALKLSCIDVYSGNEIGPAIARLAYENDQEAVDFLIKFNASVVWAIFGFALGGHKTEAQTFLERLRSEAPHQITVMLNYLALGFAGGGYKTEAYELLQEMQGQPDKITQVVNGMAAGFARGGLNRDAYHLLEFVKLNYSAQLPSVLKRLAIGFAEGKQEVEAYKFLEQVKREYLNYHSAVLNSMVIGFASVGNKVAADKLVEQVTREHPSQIFSVCNIRLTGFTYGGYKSEAYLFLEQAKSQYPAQLPEGLKEMATGFVRGGHKKEVCVFVGQVQKDYPEHLTSVLKRIAEIEKNNKKSIDKSLVLKTLSLMDNPYSRSELAQALQIRVTSYDPNDLLAQAARYNVLMKKQGISYEQLLGWIDPSLQLYLLQGGTLVRRGQLSAALFLYVGSFLVPLNAPELCDLSNKLAFQICRNRFFSQLKNQGALLASENSMKPVRQEHDALRPLLL